MRRRRWRWLRPSNASWHEDRNAVFMLTSDQKACILRKNGFAVPDAPETSLLTPAQPPASGAAMQAWHRAIEALFASYAAARAAKSLRDAQEKSQLEQLRQMASTGPRLRTQRA